MDKPLKQTILFDNTAKLRQELDEFKIEFDKFSVTQNEFNLTQEKINNVIFKHIRTSSQKVIFSFLEDEGNTVLHFYFLYNLPYFVS